MTDTDPTTTPVMVDGALTPALTWQTARVCIIFVAGIAIEHFVHDGTVVAAGIAAVTALVTYGFGIYKTIRDKLKTRKLVDMLPNEKAQFK